MIRNFILMTIAASLVFLAGCRKETVPAAQAGHNGTKDSVKAANFGFTFVEEWVQAPTPSTARRRYAIGFSIGSKGYLGGGEGYPLREIQNNPNYAATMNDFWEYDQASNTWTQKANMLFPLERAATFVIGTQGYVGTGYSYNSAGYTLSNALYQYDQASNTWTQKSSLPANYRCDATGTSIGTEGYIGTGNDLTTAFYNDWWQYDPPTDQWTQKAYLPGTWGRAAASSFSIGQYGYITCGDVFTQGVINDLWMYIPVFNVWVQKASLPAGARQYASGFNYGSYGALTCGSDMYGNYLNDFWYYDPNANTWASGLSMGGGARCEAVGFAINGTPYVGTGMTNANIYNSDFWYLTYVLL